MADFVRAGNRLVNLSNVVDIRVFPARERKEMTSYEEAAKHDFPKGNVISARSLVVEITTSATISHYDDGGDFPERSQHYFHPYTIRVSGEEAEEFLSAITYPTYDPVDGTSYRRAAEMGKGES